MADVVRGRYRHFKGGVYIVTGVATHSETGEELVIYHKVGSGLVVTDEEQRLWARPTNMWNKTVFRHGSEKPRFELLNTIPAADVVEVVRCLECKHSIMHKFPYNYEKVLACNDPHGVTIRAVNPMHFCSYGERKDGGQDDV